MMAAAYLKRFVAWEVKKSLEVVSTPKIAGSTSSFSNKKYTNCTSIFIFQLSYRWITREAGESTSYADIYCNHIVYFYVYSYRFIYIYIYKQSSQFVPTIAPSFRNDQLGEPHEELVVRGVDKRRATCLRGWSKAARSDTQKLARKFQVNQTNCELSKILGDAMRSIRTVNLLKNYNDIMIFLLSSDFKKT